MFGFKQTTSKATRCLNMEFGKKTKDRSCYRLHNWTSFLDFIRPTATIALIISLTGCALIESATSSGLIKSGPDGSPEVDLAVVRQLSRIDCGAACLAFVMTHWGGDYTAKGVEAQLPSPGKYGYSLSQMQSFAKSEGMMAFLFSGTMNDLRKHTSLGRPCIIVYKANRRSNHAVVVTEFIDDGKGAPKIAVMDPNKKKIAFIKQKWIKPRWQAIGSPVLLVGSKEEGGD